VLSGKVAVVTGASQGLGKAICEAFIQQNASVCNLDITPPAGNKNAKYFSCDLSNSDSCIDAVDSVVQSFGQIDILVNCAGILIRGKIDDDSALETFEKTMQVNVTGMVRMVRACLTELKMGSGIILNIASIQSYVALQILSHITLQKALYCN
jgi:NAD(P)-dependent dehydrogenase (short-subunit alcohol dehydrogenase family)